MDLKSIRLKSSTSYHPWERKVFSALREEAPALILLLLGVAAMYLLQSEGFASFGSFISTVVIVLILLGTRLERLQTRP